MGPSVCAGACSFEGEARARQRKVSNAVRSRTRGVLTAIVTVAAVLTAAPSADAAKPKPVPSQAQVDKAQAVAAQKAGDVASLQASLAVANARAQAAAVKAEIAAEAYNGAMWQLQQAQQATAA